MTKVALINPEKDNIDVVPYEPIGLCFLAAYLLNNGIDVKIIDVLAGQDVKKELGEYKPDYIGISGNNTSFINDAYEIVDYSRSLGITTIMGGIHAAYFPEETLKHSDIVIIGEGEEAFVRIIRDKIKKGIVYGSYLKDLDVIGLPARHLIDMDFYANQDKRKTTIFSKKGDRGAGIITSRGCFNSCIFCYNSTRKVPIRFHSPEYVFQEIVRLINDYNINSFYFWDDNFICHKARLKRICNLIINRKLNIEWSCQARADYVDREILAIVKKAGCRQISYGVESGSQRMLDILKKGTTVEQNKRAIKMTKEAGIYATASFVLGVPEETQEDIKATQDFIKENDIDNSCVLMLTPYPATKLYEMCKESGFVPDNPDWSKFLTGKYSIKTNWRIGKSEMEELYQETVNIAMERSIFPKSLLFKGILERPIQSFKTFLKNPEKIKLLMK